MKLGSTLPKGDGNGLTALIDAQLIKHPSDTVLVVALIDCKRIVTDVDSGWREATARIRHIEVVAGDDRELAETLLNRVLKERTGMDELPFEDEQ